MYNTMHHNNENTTDYLVRFCNTQKINKACNGIIIPIGVHENWMNILYPLHVTSFTAMQDNDRNEADIAG